MRFRQWRTYLVLIPGLITLGCGNNEPAQNDAGVIVHSITGQKDAIADLDPDLPIPSDATDLPMGSDARLDAPDLDGGTMDGGARFDVGVVDAPIVWDAPIAIDTNRADSSSSNVFVASLSPAQVVPAVNSSATGQALLQLSATGSSLTYYLTHNVADATQVGIFLGAGGEPGDILFDLKPLGTEMTGTLMLSVAEAASVASGLLYLEIRSTSQPEGVLRGQILRPGETLWVARLTGAQAAPPVTTSATGHMAFVLNAEQDNLRYHMITTDLAPTAVRIQTGIAAMAGGPVVYTLTPAAGTMDGVLTVDGVDLQNLADRHWYVNVISGANPNGELRGQLLLAGETLYSASIVGGNEVPPTPSTATGAAQFVLAPNGTTLMYEAVYVGLLANAAHIHFGLPGVNGVVVYPLTMTGAGSGSKGAVTINTADLLNLNTFGYYVNAHVFGKPGGEIRGQIIKQ